MWSKGVLTMGFDDFKQLVDNMQINLYLTDIQTNEIIFMNNKMKV